MIKHLRDCLVNQIGYYVEILHVPDECYPVTITFTGSLLFGLWILIMKYPRKTIEVIKWLHQLQEDLPSPPPEYTKPPITYIQTKKVVKNGKQTFFSDDSDDEKYDIHNCFSTPSSDDRKFHSAPSRFNKTQIERQSELEKEKERIQQIEKTGKVRSRSTQKRIKNRSRSRSNEGI